VLEDCGEEIRTAWSSEGAERDRDVPLLSGSRQYSPAH